MLIWMALMMLVASSSVALAQQASYAPFVIDEKTYTNLLNALAEIKYRDSANIISMLLQLEQRAQAEAAKKPEETPPK